MKEILNFKLIKKCGIIVLLVAVILLAASVPYPILMDGVNRGWLLTVIIILFISWLVLCCPDKDTVVTKIRKSVMIFFATCLFVFLIILAFTFGLVMLDDRETIMWVSHFTGIDNKTKILEFIGWIMGGMSVVTSLLILVWRTQNQEESNRLVEKRHMQECFEATIKYLGYESISVRIAAFHEFLRLIKDENNGEEYRKSILDTLYAHIRTTTTDSEYKESNQLKPTEEIQVLLNILFKSQDINRSDIKPNLQEVYLPGANLADGNLSGANLRGAYLAEADLRKADLSGADLREADLLGANLGGAFYTKATQLPEWICSKISPPPDNGGKVSFPKDLIGLNQKISDSHPAKL